MNIKGLPDRKKLGSLLLLFDIARLLTLDIDNQRRRLLIP
jgi:hypothetical protein